ncbi:transcriptional regulator, TetR family [Leifsonia xyli subsp. xyli str. CTCB07]|uniref:Transcriptional regulator, TetR family n=2 Tax=Leifsonia xyli TaxID=1575 RepID=Q6AC14_LEIXX|nr:transcriptional regulator, TetR family [Leifsonia xyli subsp. xyli str. CTCB07]
MSGRIDNTQRSVSLVVDRLGTCPSPDVGRRAARRPAWPSSPPQRPSSPNAATTTSASRASPPGPGDVGKQTVYRWWTGKSALIADCLLKGMILPDRFAMPNSGDLRTDLETWLSTMLAVVQSPEGQGLFRSLITAATENEEVGRRLRETLADPRLFNTRLREAQEAGDFRADLPIEEVAETVIGTMMFRMLARSED